MEPVEYARLIQRRWRVVAACCLVSAVAVWVVTPNRPANQATEYVADHTLVRDSQSEATPQALATVSLFLKTGAVPQRVAKRIGYTGSPALLARKVSVKIDEQVGTLTVKATANGREAASELANAFAEETLASLGERAQEAQRKTNDDLVARLNQHQTAIADLDRQIAAAGEAGRSSALLVAQRDAAIRRYSSDFELQQKQADLPPPTAGYVTLEAAAPELASPKGTGFGVPASRPMRTVVAAFVGLLLGCLVALVVERVDPRIHLRAGAERAFDLPVIAEVPYASRRRRFEILTVTDPASSVAEAYRALRAALLLIPSRVLGEPQGRRRRRGGSGAPAASVVSILGHSGAGDHPVGVGNGQSGGADGDTEPQAILVTSAAPSEGKTASVANLAASFAETGRSVLVLSCDFRRPSIHEYLGARQSWGLTEVLNGGPNAPALAAVVKDTPIPGVRIATNGSPLDNFGEVAAAGRRMIADARKLADIVLVDTAPLLVAHEATELIPAVDAVVVLCKSGHTSKEDAGRVRDLLTRLSASVAGVVLLGAPESDTGYSTYYYTTPRNHRRKVWSWLLGRQLQADEVEEASDASSEPQRKRAVI
jgi:capsular exopolysaccharide synthesis family protein